MLDTLIAIVLDETGSMAAIRDATISGMNEFIESQERQPGEAAFWLVSWDSMRWNPRDLTREKGKLRLDPTNYIPGQLTPLYDAVGRGIRAVEKIVEAELPKQVLFVVMTDGLENASKEWNLKSLRPLIEEKSQGEQAWQFVFLGANMDSWDVAQQMGGANYANASAKFDANEGSVGKALRNLATNTKAYRYSGARTVASGFWGGTPDQERDGPSEK
jgi:hypothetical protein